MSSKYISPISMDAISRLCGELEKNNSIKPRDFERYHVKRGLRNERGGHSYNDTSGDGRVTRRVIRPQEWAGVKVPCQGAYYLGLH